MRSQVAMGTGGNRLELGKVLALPGWRDLAWVLLEHCARGHLRGHCPRLCHRVSAREGHSGNGATHSPSPRAPHPPNTECAPVLSSGGFAAPGLSQQHGQGSPLFRFCSLISEVPHPMHCCSPCLG